MSYEKNTAGLTCKPITSYKGIYQFVENPPAWRTMCKELTPHSKFKIENMELIRKPKKSLAITEEQEVNLDEPETFCHITNAEIPDPPRHNENELAKTLVCHDMANGYHDDCYIDGTGQNDAYTFYNWAVVDIFCYFSHNLITIPPLGWINVAHAHGVKVIGTVITEHAKGVTMWDVILASESEYQNFANALVVIAKTLKFEGWLLNIENNISHPEEMLQFVSYLHTLLHYEIPNAELIWYDAVTISGHLNWQNGLTPKNKGYFDICDGMFTNYSWSEMDLQLSVAAAGVRRRDLYVGIDIWGRNFYGGGEFCTQDAIKVAYNLRCSLAIFAPAWTHEALSNDPKDVNYVVSADNLDKYEKFLLRDRVLWGSLWPFLSTRLPNQLPLSTSFCRGQGRKRRRYGEVISHGTWYNLRYQQYQPNSSHGPHGFQLCPHDVILARSQPAMLSHRGIIRTTAVTFDTSSQESSTNDSTESAPAAPGQSAKDSKLKLETGAGNSRAVERSTSLILSSGKSMQTMSLNLKLGQGRSTSGQKMVLEFTRHDPECLEVYKMDSFIGGSCLLVNANRTARVLHCDYECKRALIMCVATKLIEDASQQWLNVNLRATFGDGAIKAKLLGRELPAPELPPLRAGIKLTFTPLPETEPRFKKLQAHLLLHQSGFYVPVSNPHGWTVRYYEVLLPGCRVTSINVRTGLPQGGILLGCVAVCDSLTDI